MTWDLLRDLELSKSRVSIDWVMSMDATRHVLMSASAVVLKCSSEHDCYCRCLQVACLLSPALLSRV